MYKDITNCGKIYIGGPLRIKRFRTLGLYESIAEMVGKLGFEAYIPHLGTADPEDDIDEREIYRKNIQELADSVCAIFEVSYPSHGVGMEIQYAILNKIPFLCVANEGSVVSKMLVGSIESDQMEFCIGSA